MITPLPPPKFNSYGCCPFLSIYGLAWLIRTLNEKDCGCLHCCFGLEPVGFYQGEEEGRLEMVLVGLEGG